MDYLFVAGTVFLVLGGYFLGRKHEKSDWFFMLKYLKDHPELTKEVEKKLKEKGIRDFK